MTFSPRTAILGLFILVPLMTYIGAQFTYPGTIGALFGFFFSMALKDKERIMGMG